MLWSWFFNNLMRLRWPIFQFVQKCILVPQTAENELCLPLSLSLSATCTASHHRGIICQAAKDALWLWLISLESICWCKNVALEWEDYTQPPRITVWPQTLSASLRCFVSVMLKEISSPLHEPVQPLTHKHFFKQQSHSGAIHSSQRHSRIELQRALW